MKKNIIIELSEEVTLKLKEKPELLDIKHPIYKKFSIQINSVTIYKKEDLVKGLVKEKGISEEQASKLVNNILNKWRLRIDVSFNETSAKFVVMDLLVNSKIFEGVIHESIPLPRPIYSTFEGGREVSVKLAVIFNNIIAGVSKSLDSSTYQVIESKQRADAGQKKNKKKNKKSSVKYITTKRYIVTKLGTDAEVEEVQREYKKDAWQVKGFWAKTRNGRVYWREPSVRRRRKGKTDNNAEADQLTLKLNKLPEDN